MYTDVGAWRTPPASPLCLSQIHQRRRDAKTTTRS
jgi:hypothetical protein